jgi:propionyl-CoA synthetase
MGIPGSRYREVYQAAERDPETFWLDAARAIDWVTPPRRAFDPEAGIYGRWFPDAVCNTCHNALDRHVAAGRGEQTAIIWDSPVAGRVRRISYAEMLEDVRVLAGLVTDLGVAKGDRVLIYMPMIPEALVAMLACARLGAVHSVVFGGFASRELAARIEDAEPVLVLAASCGIEPTRTVAYKPLLDEAIALSTHKPKTCLVFQRPQAEAALDPVRDRDWAEAVADAKARGVTSECVPDAATDPLYILYTSGTTGRPKGVVRDTGGHLVALAWSLPNLYGIRPGEVFWTASDIGWVVGHTYIVYAPLICGATSILFEGKPVGTPDAGTFWRVCEDHGVVTLFTAPTALRAIRKEDPEGTFVKARDMSRFRALFLAGERADPDTVAWAERVFGVPIVDHWWQTETGWPITGNPLGLGRLPVKHGSSTVPMPGYVLETLDEAGKPLPPGEMGTLAIKLPLPPANLPTLWRDDARFRESYLTTFPGYYTTSDAGYLDADGYVFVMGRTDDVINVAGHRLSTGSMEEVIASHPAVAECAVIGVRDALKGEVPAGFVVLKAGQEGNGSEVETDLVRHVRERIGPVAAFRLAMAVGKLPKTRSGKILRGTMKKIADGEDWAMPATVEDPAVFEEIATVLKGRGLAGRR